MERDDLPIQGLMEAFKKDGEWVFELHNWDDICRNYHGGDENSEEANASVQVSKARMRVAILLCLKEKNIGMTCDEVEAVTGMSHQGCSARFTELRRDGMIVRTGEKRKTRAGRNAWVYRAA